MPTLYRYMSALGAVRTLETMHLRVSRLTELNDPFDCLPNIVGGTGQEKLLAREIAARLLQKREEQYGIVCFSRTWKEPLMWSHYADAHRGVVLAIKQPASDALYDVKYKSKRPVVHCKEFMSNDPSDEKAVIAKLMASMRTKSRSWSYEREVRVISELDRCEQDGGFYYTALPKTVVAAIICGMRCDIPPTYFQRLLNRQGCSAARAWKASRSETNFAIEKQ